MGRLAPAQFADAVGSLEIGALRAKYASGELNPADVIRAVYDRMAAIADPAIFITLLSRSKALEAADALGAYDPALPLWGIPFAVKDNIDVEGMPTTLACPEAEYLPGADATAVAALRAAGAIAVGKTNLDQFATGLNGTRSPYGVPRSPFGEDLIPGGSSSGSAVAVSAGLVSFALGTDTAGSGRVPAALGSIVGLKPTRGLVSNAGVYPACASLDCVTVFTLTIADAAAVGAIMSGEDPRDPYSRSLPPVPPVATPSPLAGRALAIPANMASEFFGEVDFVDAWASACNALTQAGVRLVEVDLADFYSAGSMLYGGAWLAERHAALTPVLQRMPEGVEPTVREIVSRGAAVTAGEVFANLRDVEALKKRARAVLASVDALLAPTTAGTYTIASLRADPVARNQRLGRFTTFSNLLDLAVVAVPAGFAGGVPFGVSLHAPGGSDAMLLSLASALQELFDVPLGATNWRRHAALGSADAPVPSVGDLVELAVVGAHLRGQPLHGQLDLVGAEFVRTARTTADYQLFALGGTMPPKPGLVRTGHGAPIEVEVYAVEHAGLGRLLAAIPSPLGLGRLRLDDGSECLGFLCESVVTDAARDITRFGGWRAYLEAASARP